MNTQQTEPVAGAQPGASDCFTDQRRNQRVPTYFSVEISFAPVGEEGGETVEMVNISGTTREVSSQGASVTLDCERETFGMLRPGQQIRVSSAYGSDLDAQVNGVWTEPQEPVDGEEPTFVMSMKLTDSVGWMPA